MPRAPAVVEVEDGVAPGGEEVVEHVFAVVARPPLVHVLQVARAVDEDHGGAVGGHAAGPVQPGGHRHAIGRRNHHDLRLDPVVTPERRSRALRDLAHRGARLGRLEVQLGGMVGRGVQHCQGAFVGRHDIFHSGFVVAALGSAILLLALVSLTRPYVPDLRHAREV